MPATVEDFLKLFGSGEMVDDEQANELHKRFVSTRPEDSQFDNRAYHDAAAQYIGNLPDDHFQDAARSAVTQAAPQQRQDLLSGILGALQGASPGGLASIGSLLGLSSTDPNKMSNEDAAKMMNYARKENPDALRQTVQEKPWFIQALGNPIVMGALTMAASKLLSGRSRTTPV